jgi:hypothetical protein
VRARFRCHRPGRSLDEPGGRLSRQYRSARGRWARAGRSDRRRRFRALSRLAASTSSRVRRPSISGARPPQPLRLRHGAQSFPTHSPSDSPAPRLTHARSALPVAVSPSWYPWRARWPGDGTRRSRGLMCACARAFQVLPPGALARRARRPALQAVAQRAGPLGPRSSLGSTSSIFGQLVVWRVRGVHSGGTVRA